jgi:hypothetical protein
MKPKKFERKLALRKKTVANLSNGQLGQVKGGCVDTIPSCISLREHCGTIKFTNCACPTETCTCSVCGTVCGGPFC